MSEPLRKRRLLWRHVFVAGFFASWAFAAAILCVFLVGIVWEVFSLRRFADDDIVLLAGLPLGFALGLFAAVRTRRARTLHQFFLVIGPLLSVVGVIVAFRLFEKSNQLKGVTGPFAGLSEAIGGIFFLLVVTVFGLFVFSIGLFGRLWMKITRNNVVREA